MATRAGIAVARGGQVLHGGDEVGEGVALDQHLAGVVPGLAQVAAAANVRVGHDHSAIEQAEPVGAEAERQRIAIGTVAVDVERIPARLALVFAIDERDRNLDAVRRGGVNALAGVERAVEAAGNFKLLEQRGCRRGHVVLVDRTGRDQRLVGVAEGRRLEDAVDVRMRAVGRLGKGDFARRCCLRTIAGEAPEAQARQAVFALAGDEEAGEEIHVFEHHVVAMGNQLGPVFAARRGHRRGDQAEVASAIVGADEPEAVAMVDGVFVLILARADERECRPRAHRRQHPATRWWCGWPIP